MPRSPTRRRPSMRPENIRRRMNSRVFNVLAALVIAGLYWAWDTYSASDAITFSVSGEAVSAPAAAHLTESATHSTAAARTPDRDMPDPARVTTDADIDAVISARRSNVQIAFSADVLKTLADDNTGSRHQRFLVVTPAGNRVLVAHNIDLAPRVDGLAAGSRVTLSGEFEWNEKGGVLHWTHHDPAGRHPAGWIEYAGRRFQ
jgi:hypothetical protein